jgi:monoterpene epsilon-lactone hydrolase
MHLATKEPEGVSYADEDAGGVEALWCIPADSDPEAVLLPVFGDTFPTKA